ncbi:putative ribonuclease H-like domain-containing protein [Tanacetum coccineum]
MSYSGLDEFKEPEFKGYGPENSNKESNTVKESDNSKEDSYKSLVKELESHVKSSFVKDYGCNTSKKVSDDEEQDESIIKPEKKTITPTAAKIEKPVRKSVRHRIVNTARSYRTPVNTVRPRVINTARQNRTSVNAARANRFNAGKPQHDDKGFVDSGCSRHMTGNIAYLSDFKQFDGGYVAFGGGAYGGKITGKGTLKTANLDFEDVYFVNELKFNLFSVSQMCDKKNYVLFTDTECLVLSLNFKLPDENHILLKVPRKDNMYSFDMKNIVPKESLTCLVAKATLDESMLWHRRLGHINFKNINKLVKDNLVRGLPIKRFENDQTCVACLKGKQHRASCKSKVLNPITKPLFMLHMDLFGPTFVSSLMHKKYCLVVTDDYSRFTWVFFLTTKDETSEILKRFIKEIENLVDKKVKIIRSDNGTEFKNKVMDDFCREKGIKREYSVARTPQQNGVAERRNRTLIEAARTMLADSKLPTTFWAEAVSTACYVQNRVLVVKPHNKTPYELFRGFKPALSFMRPFGCHVTILNTLDSLGKFDGKSDEGFFVGYTQLEYAAKEVTYCCQEGMLLYGVKEICYKERRYGRDKVCERQDKWKCVLTRLIDDILALDSKVRFDISDRRLELTATFSIPTYSDKKEKRVMRPSEIHKFCDATLRRTLEGLKSYYNDVKYGYVPKELTNDEVEFFKLFEEEIEVRLNYRDQMRRWEMYVNGRPLGPKEGNARNNNLRGRF